MRQKHIFMALAIFAVTGAVNHSQTLAQGLEGLDGSGVPPNGQWSYNYQSRQPEQGARQDTRSDQKTDSGSGSSNNYFQKESTGSRNSPYGGFVYGGVPTTPSADPMIKELSREPSMR